MYCLPAKFVMTSPVVFVLECWHTHMVYLSLSGMAPAYLAADCQLVSDEGRRLLRSATSRTCVVLNGY